MTDLLAQGIQTSSNPLLKREKEKGKEKGKRKEKREEKTRSLPLPTLKLFLQMPLQLSKFVAEILPTPPAKKILG